MNITIKRPLSPNERILVKRVHEAEKMVRSIFEDNLKLRVQIDNLVRGKGLRFWVARLITRNWGKSEDTGSRPAPSE